VAQGGQGYDPSVVTVGLCIKCSDGIVLACDSLTTFGRGVPVLKYSNKVHVLEHPKLRTAVAIEAAGATTFFHKFCDRALRNSIEEAAEARGGPLDILDFCESVCEPVALSMYREYVFDRAKFLQAPVSSDYSLSLIVGGATRDNDLRAYFVYQDGITEEIESYGTIGSGAAYAELFLRFLLRHEKPTSEQAARLAVYAVKGVELMDPNVGGPVNIQTLKMDGDHLKIEGITAEADPQARAHDEMEKVLSKLADHIEELVEEVDAIDVSEATEEEPKVGAAVVETESIGA